VGLQEPWILTILFSAAFELMNTVMEVDGELGIWLEVILDTFDFILKEQKICFEAKIVQKP